MTNITLPRAELQAALDALQECRQKIAYLLGNVEWYESAQAIDFADISIKAISARLAVDVCAEKQPDVEKTSQRVEKTAQRVEKTAQQGEKPEPVAWGIANTRPTEKHPLMMVMLDKPEPSHLVVPLYAAPPQRPWQGLTEQDTLQIRAEWEVRDYRLSELCRAIEAKLREKNA